MNNMIKNHQLQTRQELLNFRPCPLATTTTQRPCPLATTTTTLPPCPYAQTTTTTTTMSPCEAWRLRQAVFQADQAVVDITTPTPTIRDTSNSGGQSDSSMRWVALFNM